MSTRKKEEKDPLIYRIVVAVLGLTVIVCVIGTIVLTMTGFATPELLVALGSAAIGGLAGYWPPHQQTISSGPDRVKGFEALVRAAAGVSTFLSVSE